MDVDVVLDPKGKGKQKETKRKQVNEEEEKDDRLPLVLGKFGLKSIQTRFEPNRN